jgi:hypothetical protein
MNEKMSLEEKIAFGCLTKKAFLNCHHVKKLYEQNS